jgi:hypothetical protein
MLAQYLALARDDLLDAITATSVHHDVDGALDIVDEFVDVPPDEADTAAAMFGVHLTILAEWLAWTGEAGIDPVAAVSWTVENLSASEAELARELGGLLDAPFVEAITMDQALERFGSDVLPGLVALLAGFVATAGGGDPHWILRLDPMERSD